MPGRRRCLSFGPEPADALATLTSGASTTIWRSKRPGRSKAGSSTPARLVAAISTTESLASKNRPFHQQPVERCLRCAIVTAAKTGAALTAHGVDLADEDNGRGSFFFCWNRSRTRGRAHAHEHLDEVRAGNAEERNACFLPATAARQQRLCRCPEGHQQAAAWNLSRPWTGIGGPARSP